MSEFKIGARVKVKFSMYEELIGKEGTIVRPFTHLFWLVDLGDELRVKYFPNSEDYQDLDGNYTQPDFPFKEEELEIIPTLNLYKNKDNM